MNDSQQLVLKDFSGAPEITPGAHQLKRAALASARSVLKVEDDGEQMGAVEALRRLKAIRQGLEQSRKLVKAPVLELGRKIDALAHEFYAECDKEEMRVQGLINHYQRKQMERQAEEEAKLQREADEATRLLVEAERLRKAGREDEALSAEARAFDIQMTQEVTVVPGVVKPKGLVVRNKINFQVTDPIVFIQAYPQFWKWQEDGETLKLDRMRVLDELNKENGLFRRTRFPEELSASDDERLVRPAGLRVYEETKAFVRT